MSSTERGRTLYFLCTNSGWIEGLHLLHNESGQDLLEIGNHSLIVAHAHSMVDDLVDVVVDGFDRSIAKYKLATERMGTAEKTGSMKTGPISPRCEGKLRGVCHKTVRILIKSGNRDLIIVGEVTVRVVIGIQILLTNHVGLARTIQQSGQLEFTVLKDHTVVSLAPSNMA